MAMTLEDLLSGWTGPSSATEQDKQDRTERMIKDAIQAHEALGDCSLTVFAKGSYPNNTNVRVDSDVDIAVQSRAQTRRVNRTVVPGLRRSYEKKCSRHFGRSSAVRLTIPDRRRSESIQALRGSMQM